MVQNQRTIWRKIEIAKNKWHRIGKKEEKRHSLEEHHHSHTYKTAHISTGVMTDFETITLSQDEAVNFKAIGYVSISSHSSQQPLFTFRIRKTGK